MSSVASRFNITVKLVLFLIGVSIIPLLFVGITSYSSSRKVIQDEVSNYTQALLTRQEEYLDLLLQSLESLMINVSGVEEIKQALISEGKQEQDTYTELATHAQIGYILNSYLNLKGLVSIDIFSVRGTHYHVGDTLSTSNIGKETYQDIYDAALLSNKLVLWMGVEPNINIDSKHKKVVTAARILKTVDDTLLQEMPLGLLVVTYSTESIYDHFNRQDLGEGAYLLLLDTNNRLIFHPDKTLIGSRISPAFVNEMVATSGSFVMNINDTDMLVNYRRSERNRWILVSLVPTHMLTRNVDTIRNTSMSVILACFVFIGLAAFLVNRTMIAPIKQITALFQQIQKTPDAFQDYRLGYSHRQDEIGELLRWFNQFVESMQARQHAEHELRLAKEAAESGNRQIITLNKKLQDDNQQLETTLHELQITQQELVRSEKLAALGQLIAGVAHEINTPLGAIRASITNTADILEHSFSKLPQLFNTLTDAQQTLFFQLLTRSLQATEKPSMREIRKIKREVCSQLEDAGLDDTADVIADTLMDMEVYRDVEPFMELFTHPDTEFIMQMAYDLSGVQKNSQTIALAVDRASKVVFALKNYARYDQSSEPVEADVTDGIETVLTLYHNQLKHGVEVTRQFAALPRIPCYPDELNQVWTNLVHNALQAMEFKGALTITTHCVTAPEGVCDAIVVTITDTGKGIPANVMPRIFEPFYTTKPAGEGSGLGLSIVRQIVEKHHGTLNVTSMPGNTTFTVTLPTKLPVVSSDTNNLSDTHEKSNKP